MKLAKVLKLLCCALLVNILQIKALDWPAFVSEVEQAISNSSNHTLPTNNDAFFKSSDESWSSDGNVIDYGSYDFIIVGGGTAGGVLANRLTEKKFTVLVVEAGKEDPAWGAVLGLAPFFLNSDWIWGYNTTRQTHGCLGSINQRCFYPRGKSLGGSSVVNAGVYIRGNAKDYDRWEELGNAGWAYRDCLPYFKKAEKADFTVDIDKEYHGFNGPQNINVAQDTPELTTILLKAFAEIGKPEIDLNGQSQDGVGRVPFFLDYNIRASSSHAFIRPVLNRTNLKISLESLVTKIRILSPFKPKASGVEFVKSGRKYFANAKREVILSAGSVNSPQVLMLSGVGPAKELARHGIKLIADLPVGENLYDHTHFAAINYRTNHTFYNYTLLEKLNLWREAKRPFNAGFNDEVVGFWNYDGPADGPPEVEVLVNLAKSGQGPFYQYNDDYNKALNIFNGLTDITMGVMLLHPKSSGRITLQSNDPRDFPVIDPNVLTDPRDQETIYKGVQTVLQFNNTETFKKWSAQLLLMPFPGCDDKYDILSKEWWLCGIRHVSLSVFQTTGTTRMGPNPKNSVVDPQLKVHGFQNLRVVDAGVIPSTISGHLNAAVVMIAEKMADVIKKAHKQ